ncbi:VOC family protein [Actinomadura sp. 1N219]|uniref:VOC family protein n=1 Tax=Actinomadura sp. 1N219 TaxID=3375152 RepID=UPI00379CEA73
MITTFDHVIVLVRDIETAVRSFEDAGFQVTRRDDEGAHIAEHRLVCFADGSYLELYAFHRDDPEAAKHRWFKYDEAGEGLADYSVTTTDLRGLLAQAGDRGLPHTPFAEGGKRRADGPEWTLRMSALGIGAGRPELPFVLEDVTPREIRVPRTDPHRNGATAIAAVTILTDDPDAAASGLALLTGCDTPRRESHPEGQSTVYSFGERSIALLEPREGTEAAARLAAVGPVVHEVTLAVGALDATTPSAHTTALDPAQIHGVRLVLAGAAGAAGAAATRS